MGETEKEGDWRKEKEEGGLGELGGVGCNILTTPSLDLGIGRRIEDAHGASHRPPLFPAI